MILGFIIFFTILGFLIALFTKSKVDAYTFIISISILWIFIMGPWAIATFIELVIGYTIGNFFFGEPTEDVDTIDLNTTFNSPEDGYEGFSNNKQEGEEYVDSKARPLEEVLKLNKPKLSLPVL